MLKLFLSMALLLVAASFSFAGPYRGFNELKPKDCVELKSTLIPKLPPTWKKFVPYVKMCPLARNSNSPAKVSLVSIWAHKYLESQQKTVWENFPLPMLVDDNFHEIGTLPEIFPMDSRTEPIIYFGKWKEDLPSEIRVDIYNPTVSGNYYYSPLTWDEKGRRYRILDKEPKFGHRPRD